jgi:hypothetical protein
MAYENKTIGEIRGLIIDSIQSKFNIAFRILPKSFIRTIAAVFAGVFTVLYKQIGWLFLQVFPETSYWSPVNILGIQTRPLVKWGDLIGVGEPKTGKPWRGKILVAVTDAGGVLVAGAQLKNDVNGKLYITEESVSLINETETVPVICAENGTAGELIVNDILSFANPLGNVSKTASVIEIVQHSSDDETEAEYRARVVKRFRAPPAGGALADYRKWSLDVEGVYNVYPYKDLDSAANVFIYAAGDPALYPHRIPTSELLVKIGNACVYDPETGKMSRKPLTAVLDPDFDESYKNIKPVAVKYFDVYITGVEGSTTKDFIDAVRPALENYFFAREPYIRGLSDDNNVVNIVSHNNILSVVDQAAISVKAKFYGVELVMDDKFIWTYTLGDGELCELRKLFITESRHDFF